MSSRSATRVVDTGRTFEGEGFEVRRAFPTPNLDMIDPFLLLDEMGPSEHAPGDAKGAPDHPHRGFETVTYLLDGAFEHRDSAGNAGRLGPGDVQWMTAGAGVVHSEMPATELRDRGGRLHGFQLWVNLPAAEKMKPPHYQEIPAADIPVVRRDGVTARVIAG
ncbi:MAG: pirin family protein, partial [Acidimicrobiia bacterium]